VAGIPDQDQEIFEVGMNCLGLFLALSMHVGLEADYNNVHPHARCTVDDNIAGVYYNSEDRVSAYMGRQFELDEHRKIELGLVTGYKSEDILAHDQIQGGRCFSYHQHTRNITEKRTTVL
jgi:hypothetical protein